MNHLSDSFQKAIDILDCFDAQTSLLGITDLSRRLGLPKSTTQRLINNLRHRGLVEQDTVTGKYRLGIKLFELGVRALRQMDLPQRAKPHLQTLTTVSGETSTLAILYGFEALYTERVESPRSVRASTIGSRVPLHCTAIGKVLLTSLSDSEFEWFIQTKGLPARTANTFTDANRLKEHLIQVRQQGYAIDNQEFEDGLVCIGAPVFNFASHVIAAVGISVPLMRAGSDNLRDLISAVSSAAQALSVEMGCQLT